MSANLAHNGRQVALQFVARPD